MVHIKNRCILGILAKTIFNESFCVYENKVKFYKVLQRQCPLYENIWNRKRLSSFPAILFRQILPLVTVSYFRGQKNTLLEENIKRGKISVRLFSSVWTVYLEKIMKTHLKKLIKRLKLCIFYMVASSLKDQDNYFGTGKSTIQIDESKSHTCYLITISPGGFHSSISLAILLDSHYNSKQFK
jgi:hypothetical protein